MSRNVKSFLLVVITLIMSFVVVTLKSSQESLAASANPSTFKQVLLQYKGKNIEIGAADNSGKYKATLSAIEDDYIVTEPTSGPTTITYIPIATIHSLTRFSEEKIIIYTR